MCCTLASCSAFLAWAWIETNTWGYFKRRELDRKLNHLRYLLQSSWEKLALSLVIVWGNLIKSANPPERFPLLLSPYQLWAEEELDSATEVWKKNSRVKYLINSRVYGCTKIRCLKFFCILMTAYEGRKVNHANRGFNSLMQINTHKSHRRNLLLNPCGR